MKHRFACFVSAALCGGTAAAGATSAAPPVWPSAQSSVVNPAAAVIFTLVMPVQDEAGLQALLAAQQDPNSSKYHKWLTPDDPNARYGPSQTSVDNVVTALEPQGFALLGAQGRLLKGSGSVALRTRPSAPVC